MKNKLSILLFLLLYSCTSYVPRWQIKISDDDFEKIKSIQEEISKHFEEISDSSGYHGWGIYYESRRFRSKLGLIDSLDYINLIDLFEKGTLQNKIIVAEKHCVSYEIARAHWLLFLVQNQEVVYLNYNKDCSCRCREDDDEGLIKRIDEDWSIRRGFINRTPHG